MNFYKNLGVTELTVTADWTPASTGTGVFVVGPYRLLAINPCVVSASLKFPGLYWGRERVFLDPGLSLGLGFPDLGPSLGLRLSQFLLTLASLGGPYRMLEFEPGSVLCWSCTRQMLYCYAIAPAQHGDNLTFDWMTWWTHMGSRFTCAHNVSSDWKKHFHFHF